MTDIERIPFDFSEGGSLESAERLENILRSGHWSDRGPNYEDEQTKLLVRLLHNGGITVCKCGYIRKEDDSPELRRRAREIGLFMHKQDVSQTLINIADIFSEYEYDLSRTTYNSLFFPKLKAFVRCGGISPDKLFELLEKDGCDVVMLFHDAYKEDFFYVFSRVMPLEDFLNALQETQEKTVEAMWEALQIAEGNVTFPSYPTLPDVDDI